MYSPLTGLAEMCKTPHFIFFKVLIDGKECYGRPGDFVSTPFEAEVFEAKFKKHSSIGSIQSGSVGELIIVKADKITALEVFDVLSNKNPTPYSEILRICLLIGESRKIEDIINSLMDELVEQMEYYREDHPIEKEEVERAIELLDNTKFEFANRQLYSEDLELIKKTISKIIADFFRLQS